MRVCPEAGVLIVTTDTGVGSVMGAFVHSFFVGTVYNRPERLILHCSLYANVRLISVRRLTVLVRTIIVAR